MKIKRLMVLEDKDYEMLKTMATNMSCEGLSCALCPFRLPDQGMSCARGALLDMVADVEAERCK